MLFDPRNNVDLFAALGGISLLMALVLVGSIAELGPEQRPLALVLCVFVAVPTWTNLIRYRIAKLGCAVLPLSVVLCGLAWMAGRPFVERALLLGAPNAVFFAWDLGVKRILAWWAARVALGQVAAALEPVEVGPHLLHVSPAVRSAAVARLRSFEARAVVPLVEAPLRSQEPGPRASALELIEGLTGERAALLDLLRRVVQDGSEAVAGDAARGLGIATNADAEELTRLLRDEERAAVLIGITRGFRTGPPELVAEAALRVAGDPERSPTEREAAVDALDLPPEPTDPLGAAVAARAAAQLEAAERNPTAELLWLLIDHGQVDHAPLAAQHVAFGEYGVAHSALEAVEAICARSEDLGSASEPVETALAAGRDTLRAAHPPRDNPLADGLVERIEGLLSDLSNGERSAC